MSRRRVGDMGAVPVAMHSKVTPARHASAVCFHRAPRRPRPSILYACIATSTPLTSTPQSCPLYTFPQGCKHLLKAARPRAANASKRWRSITPGCPISGMRCTSLAFTMPVPSLPSPISPTNTRHPKLASPRPAALLRGCTA